MLRPLMRHRLSPLHLLLLPLVLLRLLWRPVLLQLLPQLPQQHRLALRLLRPNLRPLPRALCEVSSPQRALEHPS